MRYLMFACFVWVLSIPQVLASQESSNKSLTGQSVALSKSEVESDLATRVVGPEPKDIDDSAQIIGGVGIPESAKAKTSSYEPMSSWPVVIGTLIAMVACIFALAWFARRFNGFNIARNKDMEIVSSLSVGARERITLVQVKGQTLLLGVTNQNISMLHSFDTTDSTESLSKGLEGDKVVQSDFSTTLKGLLNKGVDQAGRRQQNDLPSGEGS